MASSPSPSEKTAELQEAQVRAEFVKEEMKIQNEGFSLYAQAAPIISQLEAMSLIQTLTKKTIIEVYANQDRSRQITVRKEKLHAECDGQTTIFESSIKHHKDNVYKGHLLMDLKITTRGNTTLCTSPEIISMTLDHDSKSIRIKNIDCRITRSPSSVLECNPVELSILKDLQDRVMVEFIRSTQANLGLPPSHRVVLYNPSPIKHHDAMQRYVDLEKWSDHAQRTFGMEYNSDRILECSLEHFNLVTKATLPSRIDSCLLLQMAQHSY